MAHPNDKYYPTFIFMIVLLLLFCSPTAFGEEQTDVFYQRIQDKKDLVVGLSAGYAPLEFHTTIDGKDKIVGIDISIAEKIAKDLGVKLTIKELNFDALLGAMKTGKIDVIISGMTPTEERLKEVNFSDSYMNVEQSVVVHKSDKDRFQSIHDFEGVKVGVQKQTAQEALAEKELTGCQTISLQKGVDVVLNLQNRKVDAIVLESVVAEAYIAQDKQLVFADVTFKDSQKETAIALPKNAPVLEKKINQSIHEINTQKLLPAYSKKTYKLMFDQQSFLQKYGVYFLKGTGYTIVLALIGVMFGVIFGIILFTMKQTKQPILKGIATVYIEFIRGTPLMAQIFMIYFGTTLLQLDLNTFLSSCIALSLNSAAYIAELFRAGFNAVAKGQTEAARSLGMTEKQTFRFILFPQALKNILPALGNEFSTVIKDSSVVSVIGVSELMFQAGVVQGASFKPFLPILCISFIYFILTFTLTRITQVAEKRLSLST